MRMRIGIIGGGSIGMLFASYLNQSGEVKLYTRTAGQAEIINRDGIWLNLKEQTKRLNVAADCFDNWNGQDEMTIVAVKQYQLERVLAKIRELPASGGKYMFLQNGMGHLKDLKKIADKEIYVGSVEHGAYRESENVVTHNGCGVTRVAPLNGTKSFLKTFVKNFSDSFPFVIEDDYYEMLVKKLTVNAIINPLSALLRVKNGELLKNPHYFLIMEKIFREIAQILPFKNPDQSFAQVVAVCEKTANNRSSMLKDIEQGRETEIDGILGFLLEEAESKGKKVPLIDALYHLIKGLSAYGQ
jgi:2-dehydropantoate 2-reductase